jgi:hypothetical protein
VAQSSADEPNQGSQAAVEASVWLRDQEAWNLPRAAEETIPRGVGKDEHDAEEGDPGEKGVEPPATAPERAA